MDGFTSHLPKKMTRSGVVGWYEINSIICELCSNELYFVLSGGLGPGMGKKKVKNANSNDLA